MRVVVPVLLYRRRSHVITPSTRLVAALLAALTLSLLFTSWTTAVAEEPAVAAAEAAAEAAAPPPPAGANKTLAEMSVALDTVWVLITAFLVMWMQAGFAMVETGLTRAKNAVNICMKNLLDYCFGTLAFWLVGFGVMFSIGNGFMGQSGFMLKEEPAQVEVEVDGQTTIKDTTNFDVLTSSAPLEAKFFFQLVFAATAATIVSGAMAERTKFVSYMVYSVIISLVIYPISGHWIWGGGWLAQRGFLGLCRLDGRAQRRRLVVAGRRVRPRRPHRKVRRLGQTQGDSGPQPGASDLGRFHPLAGLVRVQPGQHDGCRSDGHCPHHGHDERRRRDRSDYGLVHRQDDVQEVGSHDGAQWRAGRTRGHHGALLVGVDSQRVWPSARSPACWSCCR